MKLTKYGLLLGALGLLASCSNDKLDGPAVENPDVNGAGLKLNLSLSLPNNPGSRAISVDGNDGDEYEVDNAKLFLFADASGNPGQCVAVIDLDGNFSADNAHTDITSKQEFQGVELPKELGKATYYALVILNTDGLTNLPMVGTSWNTESTGWSNSSQSPTAYYYEKSNTKYFTMTNALGWEDGDDTYTPTVLTKITEDHLYYPSEEEAEEGAVNIYVQRIVAKVSLDGSTYPVGGAAAAVKVAPTSGDTYTDHPTDKVKLENWWLDITNKSTYPVQNLGTWANTTNTGLGWTAWGESMTSPLNRFVMGSTFHRVMWGEDVNYGDASGEDHFTHPTSGPTPTANAQATNLYCFENTMDVSNMKQDRTTKAIFKGTFYVGDNTGTGEAASFVSYNGKYAKVNNTNLTASCVDKKLSQIITDDTELGEVAALLNIAKESEALINFHYQGEVYYTAIIRHFDDTECGLSAPFELQSNAYPTDNDKQLLGRYGVLRNNWYVLTVNKITAPGSPIVPPPTTDTDDDPALLNCDVTVNILTWAKHTQGLDW